MPTVRRQPDPPPTILRQRHRHAARGTHRQHRTHSRRPWRAPSRLGHGDRIAPPLAHTIPIREQQPPRLRHSAPLHPRQPDRPICRPCQRHLRTRRNQRPHTFATGHFKLTRAERHRPCNRHRRPRRTEPSPAPSKCPNTCHAHHTRVPNAPNAATPKPAPLRPNHPGPRITATHSATMSSARAHT